LAIAARLVGADGTRLARYISLSKLTVRKPTAPLTVDLLISRLRQKVRPTDSIKTVRGACCVVGLGPYLSRAIAQAHRGSLEIRSTPDRGTRVKVCIPISDDEV